MSTTSDFTPKQTEKLRLARWRYAKDMHAHALALRDTIQKMRKMQRAMKRTVVRVAGKGKMDLLTRYDFEPRGSIEYQLEHLDEVQVPGFEDVEALAETILQDTSLLVGSSRPMTLPYENGAENDMPEAVRGSAYDPHEASTESESEASSASDSDNEVIDVDDD